MITLAINDTAMIALTCLGIGGFIIVIGWWAYSWWHEYRADRRRWSVITERLGPLGFTVVVAPKLGRKGGGERDGNLEELLKDLLRGSWQPQSYIRCVRWYARGVCDGHTMRIVELELVRRREQNVFVESFVLTDAPSHWPDFCLIRKESARRMASEQGAPLAQRWGLLTTPSSVVFFAPTHGRASALASESLYADTEKLPADEQWFVRDGKLCCHWSEPLDGDRPQQMVHRIDEFIGMMERHMLRVPRGL